MSECASCAGDVQEAAKFCQHCGAKQDDQFLLTSEELASVEEVWNSRSVLKMVSTSTDAKLLIARQTNSLDIISELATDDNPSVRSCIADNESTPPEILKSLSKDGESLVVSGRLLSVDGADVRLVVTEGKHRMVRRMLANCGHPVRELRRERYGDIWLGELGKDGAREISGKELEWVKSWLTE